LSEFHRKFLSSIAFFVQVWDVLKALPIVVDSKEVDVKIAGYQPKRFDSISKVTPAQSNRPMAEEKEVKAKKSKKTKKKAVPPVTESKSVGQ
jgi:hypothetical protein